MQVRGLWIPLMTKSLKTYLLKGANQIPVGGIGISQCSKGQNLLLFSSLAEAVTVIASELTIDQTLESLHCLNPSRLPGFNLKNSLSPKPCFLPQHPILTPSSYLDLMAKIMPQIPFLMILFILAKYLLHNYFLFQPFAFIVWYVSQFVYYLFFCFLNHVHFFLLPFFISTAPRRVPSIE